MRRSLLGQIVTAGPVHRRAARPARSSRTRATTCGGTGRVERQDARSRSTSRAGIDDGQQLRLSGRGPAAPRGGPAGDLYVVGARRPAPRARTPRRRALVPAADLDRAGRARHPDRDRHARRRARDRRRRGNAAGRAASGCAVSASRRCARRAAATSSSRSASRCPMRLNDEEAELLAQFAELRGEKVSSVARRPARAHPVRVQAVNARPARGPADANAVAHVFVDALDDRCEITGADGHHLQRVRRLDARGRPSPRPTARARGARYEVVDVADRRARRSRPRGDVAIESRAARSASRSRSR